MSLNGDEILIVDRCECILERLDNLTLSRVGSANHHESMTYHDSLVELDALLEECWLGLNVHEFGSLRHVLIQEIVVRSWELNAWEQIICDTRVEGNIV